MGFGEGKDTGKTITIEYTLPQLSLTSKTQNHYAKSNMRVEDGNICHIPQPDLIFNVFLASWRSCTTQNFWCALSHFPSHSFLSTNCTFRWMKGCFFVFIINKDFCHVAVPYIFSTRQFSLDSDHCLRCSTQLCKPRRTFKDVGFSHWWFGSPVSAGFLFFQEGRPGFIHCNTNYQLIKWYCQVIIVLYCWENLSTFMLMIPMGKGKTSM